MDENLHLVGLPSGKASSSSGTISAARRPNRPCAANSTPIYALKLHEENKDITGADDSKGDKKNMSMAAEQKTLLEGEGGVAVP